MPKSADHRAAIVAAMINASNSTQRPAQAFIAFLIGYVRGDDPLLASELGDLLAYINLADKRAEARIIEIVSGRG